jgi:hypothetical protein
VHLGHAAVTDELPELVSAAEQSGVRHEMDLTASSSYLA